MPLSHVGLRQSMKLLALAADDSSDGEMALDRGLSADLADKGPPLKGEVGYGLPEPSDVDNDFSC